MYRGTPMQVFLKATFFWMTACVVAAIINWQGFIADPWSKVIGWAIGSYAFAAIASVALWFFGSD
ncbi:hypothetical protein [Labrys neptuniae]|uniref:Uncharacterized protein n=1 Tax=Labrys neptuniae TaxID=376174 RepID=A0ABV3PG00_9HYPH